MTDVELDARVTTLEENSGDSENGKDKSFQSTKSLNGRSTKLMSSTFKR